MVAAVVDIGAAAVVVATTERALLVDPELVAVGAVVHASQVEVPVRTPVEACRPHQTLLARGANDCQVPVSSVVPWTIKFVIVVGPSPVRRRGFYANFGNSDKLSSRLACGVWRWWGQMAKQDATRTRLERLTRWWKDLH
ncbi:hypothetical protein PF004_g32979 [Phytophthora fragariae]|uniref:Uncharacterized protein n=1 Tax=Phytophthora fragariae TaxID=53985 RepID=A0A6G0M6B7_9STRA|nr:hypothetical protein PF004_g32979 [Phytophthora fragariae]